MRRALLLPLALLACGPEATTPPTAPLVIPAATPPAPPPDERDPTTWVARLKDKKEREHAVDRLAQIFEDAKATSPAEADKVRDVIVAPLAATYPASKKVLRILVDIGDRRAAPAYIKAFNAFAAGGPTEHVAYAARGTEKIATSREPVEPALADALWRCFVAFRPSQSESVNVVQDLDRAVSAVKHPSYGPKAVSLLEVPLKTPSDPEERMDILQFHDSMATRLIGELRYVPGVKPLIIALLTSAKADLQFPIRISLAQMPKESEPLLIAALEGTDPAFASLGAQTKDKMRLGRVAEALAAISRPAGRDAVLHVLDKTTDPTERATLALALPLFPSDPRAVKAFKATYATIPASHMLPMFPMFGGPSAHALLATSARGFDDPSMTDWLLTIAAAAKGDEGEKVLSYALWVAMRIMSPASAGAVGAAVNKLPASSREKANYEVAAALLVRCKQDPVCYLNVLDTPVPSGTARLGHFKAATMVGIYGSAATRDALVAKLATQAESTVRTTMLEAITALSPRGDDATATKLEQLVAADPTLYADEMIRVALKLRARAQ